MRLTDFLDPELVILEFEAPDTETALRSLAAHMATGKTPATEEEIGTALLNREQVHSTDMGDGIAIPHGTVESLNQIQMVLALAPNGVAFGENPEDPVRLFFVILSPPGQEGPHIKLLARVCRLARHPGFVDGLLAAGSIQEVVDLVTYVDAQHV